MAKNKKTKWEISETIGSADEAEKLVETNRSEIERRCKPEEIEQFKANLEELKKRQPGQQEVLTDQKSKTRSQKEAMQELHNTVISVRKMVKSADAPGNILKAFGIGEKPSKSVPGTVASGNIILQGYGKNAEWAKNEAGILEEDMTEISELINELNSAEGIQESARFSRKATTLNKDVLQRAVEDAVTKFSAMGAHAFMKKDPATATLFEELIPKRHRPAKEEEAEDIKE